MVTGESGKTVMSIDPLPSLTVNETTHDINVLSPNTDAVLKRKWQSTESQIRSGTPRCLHSNPPRYPSHSTTCSASTTWSTTATTLSSVAFRLRALIACCNPVLERAIHGTTSGPRHSALQQSFAETCPRPARQPHDGQHERGDAQRPAFLNCGVSRPARPLACCWRPPRAVWSPPPASRYILERSRTLLAVQTLTTTRPQFSHGSHQTSPRAVSRRT